MQGKGVFVIMTVDARANLEKLVEVVSGPTSPFFNCLFALGEKTPIAEKALSATYF
jgi:hypothetical protein